MPWFWVSLRMTAGATVDRLDPLPIISMQRTALLIASLRSVFSSNLRSWTHDEHRDLRPCLLAGSVSCIRVCHRAQTLTTATVGGVYPSWFRVYFNLRRNGGPRPIELEQAAASCRPPGRSRAASKCSLAPRGRKMALERGGIQKLNSCNLAFNLRLLICSPAPISGFRRAGYPCQPSPPTGFPAPAIAIRTGEPYNPVQS